MIYSNSYRYLELFLGQFYRCGNITLWGRISPSMKGIGIASFLIVTAVTLYYTTIIGKRNLSFFPIHSKKSSSIVAHAVFYLFASFREVMPWSLCSHSWNSDSCSERMHNQSNVTFNESRISSAEEYYNIYMLGINHSKGLTDLGAIKIDLFLCLILIFILMYFCIYRGVKGTGRNIHTREKERRIFSIS